MLRRNFIKGVLLLPLIKFGNVMGKDINVLGCPLKEDRLYRVESYRMLFQWVKDEKEGIYSVGMMPLLAVLSYPIYSIRIKPVGTVLEKDDNLAVVESGKRIATFPTPLSGEVVQINHEIVNNPELLNKKPYTSWIAKLRVSKPEELKRLKGAKDVLEEVRRTIIEEDIDCSMIEE
ncbi:MAG: glycine cleavage system protein H [Aquificae bacterium]|nr:glycine cleavage system protein H [Aquificota bacterium]